MTTMTEGNLRIVFPEDVAVRKFDDGPAHGLSHCMKAVDFVAELSDRAIFIEIKDPQQPGAPIEEAQNYAGRFKSGQLDEDFKYKYRDTFLYEWARGKAEKKIYYYVLVAIDSLDPVLLDARTRALQRKLPARAASPKSWKRHIAEDCAVFDIAAWNARLPNFPVSRLE